MSNQNTHKLTCEHLNVIIPSYGQIHEQRFDTNWFQYTVPLSSILDHQSVHHHHIVGRRHVPKYHRVHQKDHRRHVAFSQIECQCEQYQNFSFETSRLLRLTIVERLF